MSDIITRLLLKTDGFDANLKNSKQSVNSFQNDVLGVAKNAAAGIAKFAGGIGLAIGAVDGLTKIMGSQQATQDEWDNNVFAAKLTVDKFFTSINNGDWTSFQNGFIESLAAAKNLSAEIDALNDKRLSLTYIKSESLAKIEENKAVATDTTQPMDVRRKAFAEMQKERVSLEKKTNETIKKETDVLVKSLNVRYGDMDWKGEDVVNYVVTTNFTGGSAEFLAYKEELEEFRKKEKRTTYVSGGVMAGTSTTTTDKAAVERTAQFKQQNIELEKHRILEQEIDSLRKSSVAQITRQAIERRELSSLSKAENRIERQLTKGGGTGGAGGAGIPAPSGSLAYFDAEIAKKNKELINATDAQARAAIQSTINELERQKIELLITGKDGSLEALSIQISALKSKYVTAATDEAREEIQKLITDLESKTSYINGKAKAPLKKAGLPTQGYDTKKINPFKTESPISKKDIKLNEEYNESLAAMGSIMGSLSGAFDGNTQSVLQWGVTLISTIGQAIPAIMGMIPAKKAEAEASKESAGAAVIDAGAKTMEAHAGIPFAGIAIGLAGVASIIAVMSSMPKFATGGVVPGVSFTGDKVPAWLNSGEMILNGGQQSNLFRMLNSGLHAGITAEQAQPNMGSIARFIMPDESSREIVISGTLRASGSVLETVLNNYTHKKSKIR